MNPEDHLRDLKDPDRWVNIRTPRSQPAAASHPRAQRASALQLVAALAIALAVVAGLYVSFTQLHPKSAPAATATATLPATSSLKVFAVSGGGARTYSGSKLPARCVLEHLQTQSAQDGGPAAGTWHQTVFIRNAGDDCSLTSADAVKVGATRSRFLSGADSGVVFPAGSYGSFDVTAPMACGRNGTTVNISSQAPVEPLVLTLGGHDRVLMAKFPHLRCSAATTSALTGPDRSERAAGKFATPLQNVSIALNAPEKVAPGVLRYRVTLTDTGSTPARLSSCPTATETLVGFKGQQTVTVTRKLNLKCSSPGSGFLPHVPLSIEVTAQVPTGSNWKLLWGLTNGAQTALP